MKHLPPDFRWSFSKIAAFKQCPMSFYLTYVLNPGSDDELPGYFSQYGSLMHSILEEYYKGQLPVFCLADEWIRRYDTEVTVSPPPFPAGFGEKNYNTAIDYLSNVKDLPAGFEVLSVEKKFVIDIEGYRVSGIADLVIGSPDEVIIIDHKTKSAASMKKEYQLYRKQLYLYAIWFHEDTGRWPTTLRFNMVKERKNLDEPFDPAMVEETKRWFVDSIHEIEVCDAFEDWQVCIKPDETREPYACRWICGCNPQCDRYQEVRQAALALWQEKKKAEEDMLYYGM